MPHPVVLSNKSLCRVGQNRMSVWLYMWWCLCQKYCVYNVCMFWPTLLLCTQSSKSFWTEPGSAGYNGYNWGWPSARLFGWSAADWSRPATNKSISSERRRKSIVLLRKEIMNKLVVDLLQQKGLGCLKVHKKRCKQKQKKCFLKSQSNSMVLAN